MADPLIFSQRSLGSTLWSSSYHRGHDVGVPADEQAEAGSQKGTERWGDGDGKIMEVTSDLTLIIACIAYINVRTVHVIRKIR